MPTGQSIPVGQLKLDVINMQMFTLFQSGTSVTCWVRNKNKLKLNLLDEQTSGYSLKYNKQS